MTTITIDELETRLREVIDALAHSGQPVAVTRGGAVIAEINAPPATSKVELKSDEPVWRPQDEVDAYMARWKQLADDIAPLWPKGVSAVDAIREDRSRLDIFLARDDER